LELGRTVTIELDSREKVWEGFAGNKRNRVRKAKKSGVEIFWGRSPKLFDTFIPMYNETMDNDGASGYYYFKKDFYNSILEDLKYNSLIFYAVFEDRIISMSIILFANKQMHYHLSATDREYRNLAPTTFCFMKRHAGELKMDIRHSIWVEVWAAGKTAFINLKKDLTRTQALIFV